MPWDLKKCKRQCKRQCKRKCKKSPNYCPADAALSFTADVTSAAAGHADFTFELIGGGVASVALLALLVFASRCLSAITPLLYGPASPA